MPRKKKPKPYPPLSQGLHWLVNGKWQKEMPPSETQKQIPL